MEALHTKYRPKDWEAVYGQDSVKKILQKQIETGNIRNAYLFVGNSGCGKTTCARIFANKVNNGQGNPIEIDAASNSGVDNVRNIVANASERALDCKYKTIIIDECVSGDTEVLTNNGWKRFDELNKTELIAQYNNGNIEFVKPLEYVEQDYNGDMYKVSIGEKATFYMTPNHVQPLLYSKSKLIKEKYIKDINFSYSNYFVRSGLSCGKKTHLTAIDRLAICLQADGTLNNETKTHNYWVISVKMERKIKRLIEILSSSGLEYGELRCKRDGVRRFFVKTPIDITKKLSSHFTLSEMNYTYAEEFINEILMWDGSTKDEKYLYYSCVDKDNVDFCQAVCTMCGYVSRIGKQEDKRKETYKTVYRLYMIKKFISSGNQCVKKEKIQFCGKIYCVKVPSKMIVVRRDGYEIVTGNCHSLSNAAWQAFLKCIEEPPAYTIFIFCTTDAKKIPQTIVNRVQRFNFTRIKTSLIKERLEYICRQEGFYNYDESIDYISKLSNGGMRLAISLLDKCASNSKELSITNVLSVLGEYSQDEFFNLVNAFVDDNEPEIIKIVENYYNSGNEISVFVDKLISFILDVIKYTIFGDISLTMFTSANIDALNYSTNFDNPTGYYNEVLDKLFKLKQEIKGDLNPLSMVEIVFLKIARGVK